MAGTKALNVAIVGGGPGCKAIMDIIFAKKLSQLRMSLIGVAATNPKAVGYRYAQEKGIFTTKDYRDLYGLKELNMIIELTGHDEVANKISRTKPDHVRLMDHVAARLFWDVFQIEDGVEVQPGKVYIIPPNKEVILQQGKLLLAPLTSIRGRHLPRSSAPWWRSRY